MTQQLLTLQEYTTIAEKIILNANKIGMYIPVTDELVGYMVRYAIKSDMKTLDINKSKMNRMQLRRQDMIYALRRHLNNNKKRKKYHSINYFILQDKKQNYDYLIKEEDYKEMEWKTQIAIDNIKESNLNDNSKKIILMLLNGFTIKDIAKKYQKSQKEMKIQLEQSLGVYKNYG